MTLRDAASIGIRLVRRAGWAPIGVLLLHFVLSRGFSLYKKFPLLDVPVHFLGGLAVA